LIASDRHEWVSNHERKSNPDPDPDPDPKQRQRYLIPIADERVGVQVKLKSLENTRHT